MALAATVLTALLSAQGSGAAASDLIPILTDQVAEQNPVTQFESRPVVQSLPVVDGSAQADAADSADQDADSLQELVSQQAMPDDLSSEMRCLAGAIYFEARGETLEGQLAVGRVIVNRTTSGRFPKSYCGVVYQPSQFSFVRGRSMPSVHEGSADWREAVAVAQIASEGSWHSPARGALFFHAARVSPKWRLTRLARVDNHVFYR